MGTGKELKTAMVLAAGFGTRLLPKTLNKPKALVEVNGRPMIYHVLKKLSRSGIENVVINTHHFAEQIAEYFAHNEFGMNINLSYEQEILDTGGGIKNAKKYLENSGSFLVYNTDVASDIDISKMYESHIADKPLATLAVKNRDTSRPLIIDEKSKITGRVISGEYFRFAKPEGAESLVAFCGIHIISSAIFNLFPAEKKFDIISFYMDMVQLKTNLVGYDLSDTYWKDLGKT